MRPYDLLTKKIRGERLTREEIRFFVRGATDGTFEECQLGAMLMAIRAVGMNDEETYDLTMEMAYSGETLDLSELPGVKVDKHSTGGVGDTVTLVAAPLAAACGLTVAKMSGRGLGFTGGTLDKLESIPGMRIDLSMREFFEAARKTRLCVIGQTAELAPADRVFYAMRDVTATVDSLPLIVSSILSKKIAAGCDAVVLDVKTGTGAIMPTLEKSIQLARTMVRIGSMTGRKFGAIVTDMNQPLGMYVGNALEVEEAILTLSGAAGGALLDVSMRVAAQMLLLAGACGAEEEALDRLKNALDSGAGLQKLADMIEAQGGDARVTHDTSLLPRAERQIAFRAPESGYLVGTDASKIGSAALLLGAGRVHKGDPVDPAVGIVIRKRIGERVAKGEILATLHANPASDTQAAQDALREAFAIGGERVAPPALVKAVIRAEDR